MGGEVGVEGLFLVFNGKYPRISALFQCHVPVQPGPHQKRTHPTPKVELSLPALEQWTDQSQEPSAWGWRRGCGRLREKANLPTPQVNRLPETSPINA